MKKRFLITAILLLFFWLVNPLSAFACLCDASTFPEEFNHAAAVFSGKFIGAEYRKGIVNELLEIALDGKEKKDYEILVLKFEVEEFWKGNIKREVILVTDQARFADGGTSISDCDLSFEKGERYLIYAFGDETRLQTGACTRTARLGKAKNDLRLLGKGEKPAL